MFINNTQRRIKDTQCEYTNTRTSNAKIYMNPTLGKEVGEINPPNHIYLGIGCSCICVFTLCIFYSTLCIINKHPLSLSTKDKFGFICM